MLRRLTDHLVRLYPWPVETSEELERSLAFLAWDCPPSSIVRSGYGAGMVSGFIGMFATLFIPGGVVFPAIALTVGGGLGVVHIIHRAPIVFAAARRTTALGEAPDLIARGVLRMRLIPTAEGAAAFAAETGNGPLAASLADHVRRAAGTQHSGFEGFASEWADWHSTLRRSVLLLDAAGNAPSDQRQRILERAQSAVLEGTRRELARFAGEIRGPTTGLYAFGVLLPLALVAVLPAARAAGVPLSLSAVALIYDGALPATLLGASGWLLIRRPAAFPPPRVTPGHPDVPDRRWPVFAASAVAGLLVWGVVTGLELPGWSQMIVPLGATTGLTLVGWYRPHTQVRERTRAVEEGLPDALFLVGRRIEDGAACEVAIERVEGELVGPVAGVFADASRLLEDLSTTVWNAFLGDHGALADVPSVRARSTAALLAEAAAEGPPAGMTVVAMADHLTELRAVERDARRELATVTDTLASTATIFGPGVAGATLALASGLDHGRATGLAVGQTAGLSPDGLGLILGVYILLLSAILAGLSAGLQHGLDRSVVGYRVGQALLAATVVYPTTYVGAVLIV